MSKVPGDALPIGLPITTDRKVGGSPPRSLDEAVVAAEPPELLCGRALTVEEREIQPPGCRDRMPATTSRRADRSATAGSQRGVCQFVGEESTLPF